MGNIYQGMFGSKRARLLLAASISALATVGAHAQTAQVQPDDNAVLPELVVTAQKRTENLQTTGITASVLSGAELKTKRIETIQDLQFAVPSLSTAAAGFGTNVNIRGIGVSAPSPQVVGGVAVYRDGLFQPALISTEPYFDMANVQVLRGPQGTFVGTTSTGGAIFYESANASSSEVSGNASIGYGNFDHLQATTAVNLPVTDTFAIRLAANVDKRGSYFIQRGTAATTSPGTYREPGSLNQLNLRLNTAWDPNEKLRVVTKTSINENKTDGLASIPSTLNAGYKGVIDYVLDYNVPDTQYDEDGLRQLIDVSYDLFDGVTLRSLTGYQDFEIRAVSDFDSTSLNSRVFRSKIDEQLWSQEFNLVSEKGKPIEWVVGAYYLDTIIRSNVLVSQPVRPTGVASVSRTLKTSRAAYGQIAYNMDHGLQLEAGARYTRSGTVQRGNTGLSGLAPVVINQSQDSDQDDDAFTGKVALNWQINPDHFAYVFVAKGYKPGGVNGAPTAPDFSPEKVYDYEAGLKSTLADGHVRTQVNAFYMDYSNLQVYTFIPPLSPQVSGVTGVTNAQGASKIYGVEAQVQARFGRLQTDMGLGYVHSELGRVLYVNSAQVNGGNTAGLGPQCGSGVTGLCYDYGPATYDLAGRQNPYSPKWSLNAGVQYDFDVAGGAAVLTPRIDYSYTSGQYQTVLQNASDYQKPRTLVNASVTLNSGDWSVQGWVTNLFDKTYIGGTYDGPAWFLLPPRQYGVRLSRNF